MSEFTHRFVNSNGIKMHLVEAGQGIPVVMCHGFPELWYSWRHQIRALADAGFRAIAPDQRGYGDTACPQPVEAYTQKQRYRYHWDAGRAGNRQMRDYRPRLGRADGLERAFDVPQSHRARDRHQHALHGAGADETDRAHACDGSGAFTTFCTSGAGRRGEGIERDTRRTLRALPGPAEHQRWRHQKRRREFSVRRVAASSIGCPTRRMGNFSPPMISRCSLKRSRRPAFAVG